jgi:ABC-type cobalt transport system substrate-binding protein
MDMNKSKKILLVAFIIFIVLVIIIMFDMSSKTEFPGRDREGDPTTDSVTETTGMSISDCRLLT